MMKQSTPAKQDYERRQYRKMGPIEYFGFYLLAALVGGGSGAFIYLRMVSSPRRISGRSRWEQLDISLDAAYNTMAVYATVGALIAIVSLTVYLFLIVPRFRAEDKDIERRIQSADEREKLLRDALAKEARQREDAERRRQMLDSVGKRDE